MELDGETRIEDLSREKANEIQSSPKELDRVLMASARQIVLGRLARGFFENSYKLGYSDEDLDQRKFLNIGPGSFQHHYWRLADKKYDDVAWTEERRGVKQSPTDYYWDAYSHERLAEHDGFFNVVYSSHVIEHMFSQDAQFYLSEIKRLLKPGGVFRIVCPDADMYVDAYNQRDWLFFAHYLQVKTARLKKNFTKLTERQRHEISAKLFIESFSLLTHPDNPETLNASECIEFISSFDNVTDCLDEASRLSSRELNMKIGAHVDWYNYGKLKRMLEDSGFKNIRRSGYLQSSVPILRDPRYFDRTDFEMSLFMEAQA